jgi:hypothetical protein
VKILTSFKKAQYLSLIRKVRKGGKKGAFEKGQKKKEDSRSSNHWKKDLGHVKCFKCHKFGHHASLCPKNGKGKH